MARFDELIGTVEAYQALVAENYNRVRRLAEDLRLGLCNYLGAGDGECVHLVPPAGPFEPRPYGDLSFSIPPSGFRPLGPISFGLAIRVSRSTDWLRVTLVCRKLGDRFLVQIEDDDDYEFRLPMAEADAAPFFGHVFDYVSGWFREAISQYQDGRHGEREIGFDFAITPSPRGKHT